MTKQQDQVVVEARRAQVAAGVTARRGYQVMADEFGVSVSTIANDVKVLRKAWAKQRGTMQPYSSRPSRAWMSGKPS